MAMRIACLGWGSLIWNPRALPIRREWFKDGPFAPVEFTRKSSDDRITLVIDQSASPVRVLWAQMLSPDLQSATQDLCNREGITGKDPFSLIGQWKRDDAGPDNIPDLPAWAEAHGLDAVIWTALNPKFRGHNNVRPSADQVIEHLRELTGTPQKDAKQYIECAPRQIDTDYRRRIEAELGWSCKAC